METKIRKRGRCKRCDRKMAFIEEREYCVTCQRAIDTEEQKKKNKPILPLIIIKEESKKPEKSYYTAEDIIRSGSGGLYKEQPKEPEQKESITPIVIPIMPIQQELLPEVPKPTGKESELIITEKIIENVKTELIKPIELPKEEFKTEETKPQEPEPEPKKNGVMKEIDFGKCANWHICRTELKTTMNKLRGKLYCDECFKKELESSERYVVRLAALKDVNSISKCCNVWVQRNESKRKKILRDLFKKHSDFFVIVALLDKEIVGFMSWRLLHGWVTTYKRLISTGVFVLPKHRHKGVLNKMWNKTMEVCKFELCLLDTILSYPQYLGFQESQMKLWYLNTLPKKPKEVETTNGV